MTIAPENAETPTDGAAHRGLSRRSLLARGAAVGVGVVIVGSADQVFGGSSATAASPASAAAGKAGYGPLLPDPMGRLALPRDFSYKVVAQAGVTRLDSGQPTPSRPDGTASFPRPDGPGSVLVQNHEIGGYAGDAFPVPQLEGYVYDPASGGGTTTIEVDAQGNRLREYVSLAGTQTNCAGGTTPWGTWVSCEETEQKAVLPYTKDHGYCFEVHPTVNELNRDPAPIKAFGRFPHEALAVDPRSGQVYLTEDAGNPNGLLYRWTPDAGSTPSRHGDYKALAPAAGTLSALRATDDGQVVLDLSAATVIGTTFRATWVDVPERDARLVSTRKQFSYPAQKANEGVAGAITRSRKLEGAWWSDEKHGFFFVASFARTSDGSAVQHDGQVWFLDPKKSTITLTVRFAYTPSDQDTDADGPDNITVSPYGGVILAEDGEGQQHLIGATASGKTYALAQNQLPGDEEFTAPNFSPDARILFANVQVPGHTFAITGPFREI